MVARVKDEEMDEVVEVDVHGEMEEEASVKDEEEETKVVEAAPAGGGGGGGGGGDWLRGLMGSRAAWALQDLPWDPAVLAGPHPPNMDTPSSSPRSVRYGLSGFCWCGCTTGCWGRGGGYGWTGGGGGGVVHLDKPLRLGVVEGSWGWQRELPGQGNKRWGEVAPPPRKGGEDV